MRQRTILFLVLGWWIGWAACEQSHARDPEVRRALPIDQASVAGFDAGGEFSELVG